MITGAEESPTNVTRRRTSSKNEKKKRKATETSCNSVTHSKNGKYIQNAKGNKENV